MHWNHKTLHWLVAMAAVVALGACGTDNEDVGVKGEVLFNAIGSYWNTTGLTQNGFMVQAPVFIELSSPKGGQDTLLADLTLGTEPAGFASFLRFSGGRYAMVPAKAGSFRLSAFRDGKVLDWLSVRAAAAENVAVQHPVIVTTDHTDDEYRIRTENYTGDLTQPIPLGLNQSLSFVLVPREKGGQALLGILDLFVDVSDALYYLDVSFPATPGVQANQVRLEPRASGTGVDTVQLADALTGWTGQVQVQRTGKYVSLPHE